MSDLISREAVLESLKTDYSLIMFDSYGNLTFAGERIVEAIKGVPSVEPEKCGDCISRQAARNALLNKGQHSKRYKLGETWELNLMEIEEALGELPSVTPERPRGKWIEHQDRKKQIYAECSNCGFKNYAGILNYCPDCGADMKGEHT